MTGLRYEAPPVAEQAAALVERYVGWLRATDVSAETVRKRRRHLYDLATVVPDLLDVTPAALTQWIDRPEWGQSSRHSGRTTLRRFYEWCLDEELIARDPSRRVPKVRQRRATPRPVPLDVFARAYARADVRGRRQLLVARYTGLRRMEVAQIHARDLIDLGAGQLALNVRGKGGHERIVPLHPLVSAELAGLEGYLFPGRQGAGTARGKTVEGHLHPDTVGRMVSDLLGPGWTMHTLRHRAASDWYAVTLDIRAVQELLGHASVLTTQRYTAVPQGNMLAAVLGVA